MDVYIDPSYTGTGIFYENSSIQGFALLSQAQSKIELKNYLQAAFNLRDDLVSLFKRLKTLDDEINVIIEAPFPGGASSCGLYGLQFLLQDYLMHAPEITTVKSLSPSFIHGYVLQQIKIRNLSDKDSTGSRKKLASKLFEEFSSTKSVENFDLLLKHAGGDVATAYLFAQGLKVKKATLVTLKE